LHAGAEVAADQLEHAAIIDLSRYPVQQYVVIDAFIGLLLQ
jgi:hypothetical protein